MFGTGDQKGPGARRRQAYRTAGLLAAIVGAIFAAWQVKEFIQGRLRPAIGKPAMVATNPSGPDRPAGMGVGEALSAPLSAAGLVPLNSDPAEIPPPAGSRRVSAFRRSLSGQVQEQARYELACTAEAAATHYRAVLAARGMELLRDSAGPGGRRDLVFARGLTSVTVGLPKRTQQAKIRIVVVSALRPTRIADTAK